MWSCLTSECACISSQCFDGYFSTLGVSLLFKIAQIMKTETKKLEEVVGFANEY